MTFELFSFDLLLKLLQLELSKFKCANISILKRSLYLFFNLSNSSLLRVFIFFWAELTHIIFTFSNWAWTIFWFKVIVRLLRKLLQLHLHTLSYASSKRLGGLIIIATSQRCIRWTSNNIWKRPYLTIIILWRFGNFRFNTNLEIVLIGRILNFCLLFLQIFFTYLFYSKFSFIRQCLTYFGFMKLLNCLSICLLLFKEYHSLFALLISFLLWTAFSLYNLVKASFLNILLQPLIYFLVLFDIFKPFLFRLMLFRKQLLFIVCPVMF